MPCNTNVHSMQLLHLIAKIQELISITQKRREVISLLLVSIGLRFVMRGNQLFPGNC